MGSIKRIIHGRAEIWNLSSSVHIDIERVSAANEWDIECEHQKINSISPSVHVQDFRPLSEDFRRYSKIVPKVGERLWTFSEDLPKVDEDFRGGADDVSIIQHHLWLLFNRFCNFSKGNLKTCDNNLIFLHVKISYFYMWKYMDFLSGRNPDKTLVFI